MWEKGRHARGRYEGYVAPGKMVMSGTPLEDPLVREVIRVFGGVVTRIIPITDPAPAIKEQEQVGAATKRGADR